VTENNNNHKLATLERRLNDEKIDNLTDKVSSHEQRLTDTEKITGSWKTERRLFMYVIAGLQFIVMVVLFGIYTNISQIKTEMGLHFTASAGENATFKGELKVMETKLNNLNEKVDLQADLAELKKSIENK
jgi:hypothetical protein